MTKNTQDNAVMAAASADLAALTKNGMCFEW
jgi:hypothetical protein